VRKAVSGLRAWLVQRVSAVYMLLFIVYVLVHFMIDRPQSYLAWRGWMTGSGARIAAAVFFAALMAHAWVGLRDVIIDYVHPIAARVGALALLGLGLTATGAWVIQILWLRHG